MQLYSDGEVTESKRALLEAHLAHCQSCHKDLQEWQRLNFLLRSSVLEYGPVDSLEESLWGRIRELRESPKWVPEPEPIDWLEWIRPWIIQVAMVWLVAILLGGGFGWFVSHRVVSVTISSDISVGQVTAVLQERMQRGVS